MKKYADYCIVDPFHWAWLKQAREPFSEETRAKILPHLDDVDFVLSLCDELKRLFKVLNLMFHLFDKMAF